MLFAVARALLLTPIIPTGPTALSDGLYILVGNAQNFLFLAKSRTPFSSFSYSNISALFKKHFSVKLTTNDLGKCIVDDFLLLPASGNHALRYFLLHSER